MTATLELPRVLHGSPPAPTRGHRPISEEVYRFRTKVLKAVKRHGRAVLEYGAANSFGSWCPCCPDVMRVAFTGRLVHFYCNAGCPEEVIAAILVADDSRAGLTVAIPMEAVMGPAAGEWTLNAAPGERSDPRDIAATEFLGKLRADETDLGNAQRFVIDHRRRTRFAPGLGWHIWDDRVWRPDTDGAAERLAKDTARGIRDEASALGESDEKAAKHRFAHAMRSQSRRGLDAMLSLAQTEAPLVVAPGDLDADPYLLAAANGTIDLRTGALRRHDPADLITKLAPAPFEPDARHPAWERFLHDATDGDYELAGALQSAAGYSLTGVTSEEILLLLIGRAGSGKSTLLEALKATLGDYAASISFHTLLTRRGNGPSGDLARLAGARLVVSSEVPPGAAFDAATVKVLTGGDTIVAAFKYRDEFEYKPAFTLWLAANDAPKVDHDDDAMWRRIRAVPLDHAVDPAHLDRGLKATLTEDSDARAAILAWAVRGCLDWQRNGLSLPSAITERTEAYRAAQDPLRDWVAECCRLDPTLSATPAELRHSYERWCRDELADPLPSQTFYRALKPHGRPAKSNGRRVWRGIAVATLQQGRDTRDTTEPSTENFPHTPAREGTFPKGHHVPSLPPLDGGTP